jgi:flavin-dependent dehydrogenase
MRLPGLVPVGDALHAGDPAWCSGVAVALASALACARAVRARRDADIAGAEAAAHVTAVWTEVWAEAARVAGKAACASARLPGPSARDLAVWLTGSVPASVG